MCCTDEEKARYNQQLLSIVDTHIAPSFAKNVKTNDFYAACKSCGSAAACKGDGEAMKLSGFINSPVLEQLIHMGTSAGVQQVHRLGPSVPSTIGFRCWH